MTAPLKPWERAGVNSQRNNNAMGQFADQMSSSPTLLNNAGVPTGVRAVQSPPPVPARNVIPPHSGYSGGFNGYGCSGYGGYSGYSGLGGMGGYSSVYSPYGMHGGGMYGGYGMNRFGTGVDDGTGSSFAQQAELSSRQAFQSIESVVQAVGSVAAMLESTFQAVYNSFRAVIGVADHMSRLRSHLTRIFSALAIFRTLKWLAYRLLNFLRLRSATGLDDELWSRVNVDAAASTASDLDLAGGRSNWPVMLFFAIIVGGPWLIWKFLSTLSGSNVTKGWATGDQDHFVAVAEYSYEAENPDELSFQQGNSLNVAPKELQPNVRGWLMASVSGSQKTGLVPANYVKVIGKRRGKQAADLSKPTSQSAPLNRPVRHQQSESDLAEQFNVASSVSVLDPSDESTNSI